MISETMVSKQQPAQTAAYDIQLLFAVLFLVGIGMVMVYSASSAVALEDFKSDYFFLKKQALFALLGIVALVICRHFPYRFYRLLVYPLLGIVFLCLIAVLFTDLGFSAGGSLRWLRFGIISFQPSELARFAFIIYLAYSMEKKGERLRDFSVGILPHAMVFAGLAFLILKQPDFGSVVILGALTGIMLFIGGARILYLAAMLTMTVPVVFYYLISAEYRIKRIMGFLNPWEYPSDEGYQIVHSLMAFGTGGLWGAGIGNGYQKLFYLPEPHTDFIFSVIGEELGFLGVLLISGLYGLVIIKGIRIARNAPDEFGSFLAIGLISAMGLQICVNMGVTLGLLPTKGLTLPFLSYGGTSLLLNMASIGILMNIGAARIK